MIILWLGVCVGGDRGFGMLHECEQQKNQCIFKAKIQRESETGGMRDVCRGGRLKTKQQQHRAAASEDGWDRTEVAVAVEKVLKKKDRPGYNRASECMDLCFRTFVRFLLLASTTQTHC